MDHESVAPLLSDLVAGRLEQERSNPGWSHVAACRECQDLIATIHALRQAAGATAPAVPQAWHPDAGDLVRFSVGDKSLADETRGRIADHLRSCGSCAREQALTRRAHREAGRGWEAVAGALGWRGPRRAAPAAEPRVSLARLAPALAALALLLAYPAWLGLIEGPRLRAQQRDSRREIETLRAGQRDVQRRIASLQERLARTAGSGGGARLLVLAPPRRGAGDLPGVSVAPGQAQLPVLIEHDPRGGGAAARVEVRLLRMPAATAVWRTEAAAADLWDPGQRMTVLLLPAAGLAPGEYRLEVDELATAGIEFSRRFTVTAR